MDVGSPLSALNLNNLRIDPAMLRVIADLDRFNGAGAAADRLAPDRLRA